MSPVDLLALRMEGLESPARVASDVLRDLQAVVDGPGGLLGLINRVALQFLDRHAVKVWFRGSSSPHVLRS